MHKQEYQFSHSVKFSLFNDFSSLLLPGSVPDHCPRFCRTGQRSKSKWRFKLKPAVVSEAKLLGFTLKVIPPSQNNYIQLISFNFFPFYLIFKTHGPNRCGCAICGHLTPGSIHFKYLLK